MNTTHPGLLAAILAEPQRDDLRLIMADWLDEHGQEDRAAFIRTQIELAQLPLVENLVRLNPGQSITFVDSENVHAWRNDTEDSMDLWLQGDGSLHPMHEKRQRLEKRDRELFEIVEPLSSESAWLRELPPVVLESYTYHRGFISRIAITSERWIAHADAITAQQPIEAVELATIPMLRAHWPTCVSLEGRTVRLEHHNLIGRLNCDVIGDLLSAEWPRIRFTLPSATDIGSVDYRDLLAEMRHEDAVIRGTGGPAPLGIMNFPNSR